MSSSRWRRPRLAGAGEAAARRAPEHRAARRACAGARGQPDRRSQSAPPRARHVSAVRGQRPRAARRLSHAGRRRADRTVRRRRRPTGCSTTSTWSPPRSPTSAGICRARTRGRCPTLASREHAGQARVYAIAVELIRHSDSRLDRQQLIQFLNSYQRVAPLTIGELWAWPSMLKLALIENLRRLAEELLSARAARGAADTLRGEGRRERQHSSALPPGPDTGVHRPAAAPRPRVRAAAVRDPHRRGRRTSRRGTRRPKTRFAASTSVRASRRSRWPTP